MLMIHECGCGSVAGLLVLYIGSIQYQSRNLLHIAVIVFVVQ